jgi:hypothetical protein
MVTPIYKWPPPPKTDRVKERTFHIPAVIELLQRADKCWNETELDAFLMAAERLLLTTRPKQEEQS